MASDNERFEATFGGGPRDHLCAGAPLKGSEPTQAAAEWAAQERTALTARDKIDDPLLTTVTGAIDAYVAARARHDAAHAADAARARAEARAAALAGERDAAREARTRAEARAEELRAERNAALKARASLLAQVSRLTEDRAFLAQQVARAYHRPWRPLKHLLNYQALTAFSALSAPFSKRMAARFGRSAEKRHPGRFDKYLGDFYADATDATPLSAAPTSIEPLFVARRILVADWRVPRPDVSAGELATVGILKDLLALGYEVTFVPTDMQATPGYATDLRSIGVDVVTRESGYEYAADYVKAHGDRFGVFYLFRVDVAEIILPLARRLAPAARVIFHAPDLYFLRETREAELQQNAEALAKARVTRTRELAIMRSADHVVVVSPAELTVLRAELPETPISVFPALYAPVAADPRRVCLPAQHLLPRRLQAHAERQRGRVVRRRGLAPRPRRDAQRRVPHCGSRSAAVDCRTRRSARSSGWSATRPNSTRFSARCGSASRPCCLEPESKAKLALRWAQAFPASARRSRPKAWGWWTASTRALSTIHAVSPRRSSRFTRMKRYGRGYPTTAAPWCGTGLAAPPTARRCCRS